MKKLISMDESTQAMDQALRFLSHRFLSCYELRQKMRRKEYSPELIEEVVEKLLRWDYLNDERLAGQVLKSFMSEGKYGVFFIKQKMKLRGLFVPDEITSYNEVEAAFNLVEKKFHFTRLWEVSDVEDKRCIPRQKVMSFLNNRGFSPSTIRTVCSEVSELLIP